MLSDDLRQLENRLFEFVTGDVLTYGLRGNIAQPMGLPDIIPDALSSSLSDHGEGRSRHQIPARWALSDGRTIVFNWSDAQQRQNGIQTPARSVHLGDSALGDDRDISND